MKSFTIILSLVFAVSAHADLKVGDSARYTMSMGGQNFELSNEVTAINTSTGKFTVKETIFQGGAQVQQQSSDEDIAENTQNESMFDNCFALPAEVNPRFETVLVPAGRFNTCHITGTNEDGSKVDAYYGKVVFGAIKATVTNPSDPSANLSMELKSFKKN